MPEIVNLLEEEDDSTNAKRIKLSNRGPNCANWRFTWHCSAMDPAGTQHPDATFRSMELLLDDVESIDYAFMGRETCPNTGSKHLQGFIHFSKKQRLSALKKIHPTIAWFTAEASWEDNYIYCTKEDKEPHVIGELPQFANNGAREKKRWDVAWDLAKKGNLEEIPKDILMRTYTGCKMIYRDHQKKPQPLEDYNAEWIWGVSGSGKSTLARVENPESYPKECNKWWCGYQNEECVLVEDIDPDCAKFLARFIKVWADKFAFISESKQGSIMIRPKKIVFTSQYTIEECFSAKDAVAIRRRCRVRKIEAFKEVPDDSAPSEDNKPGTVTTFVVPTCPTPEPSLSVEDKYKDACRDIRKGYEMEIVPGRQPDEEEEEAVL